MEKGAGDQLRITNGNVRTPMECIDLDESKTPPLDLVRELLLFPNFVSQDEHDAMVAETQRALRRLAGKNMQPGHFDGVIRNYRECSVSSWGTGTREILAAARKGAQWSNPKSREVLDRMSEKLFALAPQASLGPVHVLHLAPEGEIAPHVDNLQHSGALVAGLCLLSPAVMLFRHQTRPSWTFKALLKPRTFYIMTGRVRRECTHEIPPLGSPDHRWRSQAVPRGHRIAVMLRDEKGINR